MTVEKYGMVKVQNVRYDGSFEVLPKNGNSCVVKVDDFLHIDSDTKSDVMALVDSWIASIYTTAKNKGERHPFKCEVNTRKGEVPWS